MSMYPIASYTFPSGSTNTFTFTNIPQTFTHLQIRVFGRDLQTFSTFDNLYFRLNSDAGANYAYHLIQGDGASATSNGVANSTFSPIGVNPSVNSTANVFGATIIDILDYTNTNKFKTVRAISGADANGTGYVNLNSGLWLSTAAVTTIDLGGQNTNGYMAQYSRFDLYGISTSNATGA